MGRFYFTSLRDRLILLILACILPLLGLTVYNGIEDRRLAILHTQADMLKASKLAVSQQAQVLQDAQQLLLMLAKFTRVHTPEAKECEALLSDILKSYAIYENIGVVKPNGEVVCSALPRARQIERQERFWLQKTITNRNFTVDKHSSKPNQSSIVCAYPILNEQNQLELVVFLTLNSSWLRQLAPKILLPEGATLSILDRNGLPIASYPEPKDWQVKSAVNMPIIKNMLVSGKNIANIRGADGSEHLYVPVEKNNVIVDANRYMAAVGISQAEPFAQANQALKRNLLGLGIVTAIALVIAWTISELFWIRPLKKLVNATTRLAAGDLTARTNLAERDEEFSQLARTFDYMAASLERQLTDLQRAETEVRQLNQTLEQKVKERTAQLEFINKELEAFSYSVSHDLRAPLRHITGFVEALATSLESTGALKNLKIARYVEAINSSSQKMGLLIDGLLSLSRIGQKPLVTQKVELRNLVDTAIALVIQHTDNSSAKFIIADLPTVEGDPALLQQVFTNLIDNAVKFSRFRCSPQITIGSLPNGTIFVRDNGIGFQVEYADKLFSAFQRLHSQKDFPGMGIGLAIVQRIIYRHEGMIWVESQPNLGTTFYFRV